MSLTAEGGSGQSAAIHTAFALPLRAVVADEYGNRLGGSQVTFSVPASGASAAWSGSLTMLTLTTDISGTASAPALTANGSLGVFNATATSGAATASYNLSNLQGNTLTTISSSKNPSAPGETVTFTVTVTSPSGTPAGTVAFSEQFGLTPQGSGGVPLANGVATFTISSLGLGTHNLLAQYSVGMESPNALAMRHSESPALTV